MQRMHSSAGGVLALCLAAAAANAQTFEYRWVERHNQTLVGPSLQAPDGATVAGHTGNDATILLTFEARVLGGSLGLASFGGSVITSDPFGVGGQFLGLPSTTPGAAAGTLVNAARTNVSYSPSYQGYVDGDGTTLPTGRGVFNPYRLIVNLGDIGQGVLNDTDYSTPGLQTPEFNTVNLPFGVLSQNEYINNNTDGSEFGLGAFIPLFAVRYDVTNFSGRTLTFTHNGFFAAFSGFDAQGIPIAAGELEFSATYSVQISPAPGAAALLGLGGVMASRRRRK